MLFPGFAGWGMGEMDANGCRTRKLFQYKGQKGLL